MSRNYKYNILKEEVESEDFYEVQTHEKIKSSLVELIKNEDEGVTIGLSGQWGSGKSTIINLLKQDAKKLDYLSFFYFDAWAHEGDPLRRVFLESFIISLKNNVNDEKILDALEEKRKEISKEKKTKTISVKRSTTKLGLMLTIATFFFTIGIALLSAVKYEIATLNVINDSVYTLLLIGIIFSFSPFGVLIYNYCKLHGNKEELYDINNWSFLQNNSTETITEDLVGDEERSSIEFEKFFKEILEIYNDSKSRKIIIIIDNLDRVDALVSLKIWSTLQTFIQHKNPTAIDYPIFKNIFTIIPYDEESLKKIWINYNIDEEGKSIVDEKFSSSFFDKSFQVRIDVPKPIISNWLVFTKKMMGIAFVNWDKKEEQIIIDILEKTRNGILDNPNPREIKTYLNQIGFLRNHFPKEISTKSIAFYTYKRYLQGFSNDKIASYLLDKTKIPKQEINLIEDETVQELAAIIYGVNKKDGAQILLTPKILKALNNNESDNLKDIISNYNNVFWSIFKSNITSTDKLSDYFRYSSAINTCYNLEEEKFKKNFIAYLTRYLKSETDFNYHIDLDFIRNLKSSAELFFKSNNDDSLKLIWDFFIKVFEYQVKANLNENRQNEERNRFFIETLNFINGLKNLSYKIKVINIDYTHWVSLAEQDSFLKIAKYIQPDKNAIIETSNMIKEGSQIDEISLNLLNLFIESDVLDLQPMLNQLEKFFKWNNGSQSVGVFNFESIQLLENLYYNYFSLNYSPLLESHEIYSVCYYISSTNEKAINIIATICLIHFNGKVEDIDNSFINSNNYASLCTSKIRDYWYTSNLENALYTYEKLKKYNLLNIVWKTINNNSVILCHDILNLMIEHDDNFFKINDPFSSLINLISIENDDFDIGPSIKKIYEHSKLEKAIIENKNLNVLVNDYLIYEILSNVKSQLIFDKVISEVIKIESDSFLNSLINDDYLFNILLLIKENDITFTLDKLNEVLFDFIHGSYSRIENIYNITKWQNQNWSSIVHLLNETHFDNFSKRITKLFVQERNNLDEEFILLNKGFINSNFLVDLINKEIDSLELYIQESLQNVPNIDNLKFLENLFMLENGKKIKFSRNYKKLITDNLLRLINSGSSDEVMKILYIIAKRFSITLPN
jgi:hypothetical protein